MTWSLSPESTHKGYNQKNDALMKDYKYQYNGKEKQEELGLNFYDYGARNYDTAIGRWMNVDPLAEQFLNWNPYHYVHNNPINLIDPTGMSATDPQDPSNKGWTRFWGATKVFGGTIEMLVGGAGGIATSWTGVGAVVGGAAIVHGADVASAGLNQLVKGEEVNSFTSKGLQSIGVSQENAELIDAGISISLTAGTTSYSAYPSKISTIGKSKSYSQIGSTGKVGEDALKNLGGESQVYFKTDKGGRYIDQLVNGAAHESKVGYTTLNKSTKTQISKDAALIKSRDIKSSTWHFFESPVTKKIGPSKPLLNELKKNGIQIKVH